MTSPRVFRKAPLVASIADGTVPSFMPLEVGERAPSFSTQTDNGSPFSLEDVAGQTVVLYFYPRADTPGCTKQACGLRDDYSAFERIGARVIGCSPDTAEAQAAFKEKFALPFTLLADPEHEIANQFGVWALKDRPTGEQFWGVLRTTFVMGPDGTIQHVFNKVDPTTHAGEVLQALGR